MKPIGKSLVISFVVAALTTRIVTGSPTTWSPGTGGNGHSYEVILNNQASWSDAKVAAGNSGGHLVTIGSAAEQLFVESLLLSTGVESGAYWIGLRETSTEGVYAWITDEPLVYTNWDPGGEPNNAFGTEDSGHILWTADVDATNPWFPRRGQWNDLRDAGWDIWDPPQILDLARAGYIVETVPEPSTLVLARLAAAGLAVSSLGRRRTAK